MMACSRPCRPGTSSTSAPFQSNRAIRPCLAAAGVNAIEMRLGAPKAIASFGDLETLPVHLVPGWVRPRPRRPLDGAVAGNLRKVQAHGITVAAGSDAGNIGTLHGPALHRELDLMVQAGLTPLQALTAATRGGAAVMGRRTDLGTVSPASSLTWSCSMGTPWLTSATRSGSGWS